MPQLYVSYGLRQSQEDEKMAVVKVIEIIAESPESWEDAARQAVANAAETIRNIRSVWIEDMQAIVENEQVARYRLTAKISFVVEPNR